MSHDVSKVTPQGFAVVIDANEVIISHPDPKRLYHSIGALSPEALKQIDPKLQYGVERIESVGQDDIARALRQGHEQRLPDVRRGRTAFRRWWDTLA